MHHLHPDEIIQLIAILIHEGQNILRFTRNFGGADGLMGLLGSLYLTFKKPGPGREEGGAKVLFDVGAGLLYGQGGYSAGVSAHVGYKAHRLTVLQGQAFI